MDANQQLIRDFLHLIETKCGGLEKITAIVEHLGKEHPKLYEVWITYMHVVTAVVCANPEAAEPMSTIIADILINALSGEKLQKIQDKVDFINANPSMSPEVLEFHKEELQGMLKSNSPVKDTIIKNVLIPDYLRDFIDPHRPIPSSNKPTIH